MSKEENVINYYLMCNKLKDTIRTGWLIWDVKKERLESVAEHIYGVQMLAIAMNSEYNYDIDIKKVIMMLAVHELEEITIGDLTLFDISKEDKKEIGSKAVGQILNDLVDKKEISDLVTEFDEQKTKESIFAFYCDKLEADLQAKIYNDEGLVNLDKIKSNKVIENDLVNSLLNNNLDFGHMWLKFSQETYNYDENFKKVSDLAYKKKLKK